VTRLPNYTHQIQIRFGATSWGKIQTEHPSLLTRIVTESVSLLHVEEKLTAFSRA
jgi:hypothetical protein